VYAGSVPKVRRDDDPRVNINHCEGMWRQVPDEYGAFAMIFSLLDTLLIERGFHGSDG
jgi:hypothetical protein